MRQWVALVTTDAATTSLSLKQGPTEGAVALATEDGGPQPEVVAAVLRTGAERSRC